MSKFRGFTLIELLVAISIIAILSIIALVAYSAVLKQGRDSKRQSDLRSIQSALEQYNSDQGFYPATITFDGSSGLSYGGKTYLNTVPTDPTGSPQYSYAPSPLSCDNSTTAKQCTSYCLYANLENSSSSQLGSCPSVTGYNFAVTPP